MVVELAKSSASLIHSGSVRKPLLPSSSNIMPLLHHDHSINCKELLKMKSSGAVQPIANYLLKVIGE